MRAPVGIRNYSKKSPAVRAGFNGIGAPMLMLNEDGQQIVAYAAPIRNAREVVLGVLMLSSELGEIEKELAKMAMDSKRCADRTLTGQVAVALA